MNARSTRRSDRLHIGVAALAIAFGATTLAELWHVSAVQHDICAEHHRLVHRSASPSAHLRAPRQRPAGLTDAPDQAARMGHEHCLVCLGRHDRASVVNGPSSALLLPGTQLRLPTSDAARPHGARLLYRLAPKNSPPA